MKQKGLIDTSNYRPITILPIMSKLLERVVYQQLTDYLNVNDLLSPNQSGFRKGYSTMDTLLFVTDCWKREIDSGKIIGSVFFRFEEGLRLH